jgi:cell division protein FtsZ
MIPGADVRVVGVGGAGGNALRHMISNGIAGATLVAANTDTQALLEHPADVHVVLGRRSTRGLGAGGRPSVGFSAAQESSPELHSAVAGADLVFVAAGLGGGTGTGAAPLVAHLAREEGALVVGVVTLPFGFEGGRRTKLAMQGLEALREQVDSLLVIPNDRLLELDATEPSVLEAFQRADMVLGDGVRGIGDLVVRTGLVNLDFADVSAVLRDGGRAVMGVGHGRGPDRAVRAVEAASRSPLLADDSIEGARGVLMCFTIDPRLGLSKIHEAAARVQAAADDDAEILFGVAVDPSLCDEVRVTLVAAGLDGERSAPRPEARPAAETRHDEACIDRPYEPVAVRRRNALVMLR